MTKSKKGSKNMNSWYSWNLRSQTKEELKKLLEKKYKEIDGAYKMLRKLIRIEDARRMLEEIWQMKNLANDIELELMRREYEDGETQ